MDGDLGRVPCLEGAWKLCLPSHMPCTVHLFLLVVPKLYPFIINWKYSKQNVSLSSVSHSINQTHEGNGKEDVVYMCVCVCVCVYVCVCVCIYIYIYIYIIYIQGDITQP